jgi:hypothetical protein
LLVSILLAQCSKQAHISEFMLSCFSAPTTWLRPCRASSTRALDGHGPCVSLSVDLPSRLTRFTGWAACMSAAAFLYMFLFQEETNYRRHLEVPEIPKVAAGHVVADSDSYEKTTKEGAPVADDAVSVVLSTSGRRLQGTTYSFVHKLRLYTGTYLSWKDTLTCVWRPWYILLAPSVPPLTCQQVSDRPLSHRLLVWQVALLITPKTWLTLICRLSIWRLALQLLYLERYLGSHPIGAPLQLLYCCQRVHVLCSFVRAYSVPVKRLLTLSSGSVSLWVVSLQANLATCMPSGRPRETAVFVNPSRSLLCLLSQPSWSRALFNLSTLLPATYSLLRASLILWGVGSARGIHWIGLAFGVGMMGFTNGLAATLSLGYALDCYRELGTEVMIAVIIVRNSLAFAIGYGITRECFPKF